MAIESGYYNYYNVKGRYSPETPSTPGYKRIYKVTTDKIKTTNNNPDSDTFKAYEKLEEVYYSASVGNRSKCSTVSEVYSLLNKKYYSKNSAYSGYSKTEKEAMYHNELSMTLYGCIGSVGSFNTFEDPHLDGPICEENDSSKKAYNSKMVSIQFSNVLKNAGIDLDLFKNSGFSFSISPVSFLLTVSGVEDEEIASKIEEALNSDRNSLKLFYYLMKEKSNSITEAVKTKYRAMQQFYNITGQDLRNYTQTKDGFYNEQGGNALDIYKEALRTSTAVPSIYKGVSYSYFSELLSKIPQNKFDSIPDLILNGTYKDGVVIPITVEESTTSGFNAYA